MVKNALRNRRWPTVALVIMAFAALGYIAIASMVTSVGDRVERDKTIRHATATVTNSTSQELYLQIDDFDQIEEPDRGRLLRTEKERAQKGEFRKINLNLLYRSGNDKIRQGDKLLIEYQWKGGDEIYVRNARLSK